MTSNGCISRLQVSRSVQRVISYVAGWSETSAVAGNHYSPARKEAELSPTHVAQSTTPYAHSKYLSDLAGCAQCNARFIIASNTFSCVVLLI